MLVPNASVMSDDHLARHLNGRHGEQLGGLKFKPEPGETELRLRARGAWLVYHERLHIQQEFDHEHEGASDDD